jgi:hypothetical protein
MAPKRNQPTPPPRNSPPRNSPPRRGSVAAAAAAAIGLRSKADPRKAPVRRLSTTGVLRRSNAAPNSDAIAEQLVEACSKNMSARNHSITLGGYSCSCSKFGMARQATMNLVDQDLKTYQDRNLKARESVAAEEALKRAVASPDSGARRLQTALRAQVNAIHQRQAILLVLITLEVIARSYLVAFEGADSLDLSRPGWPAVLVVCEVFFGIDILLQCVTSRIDRSGTHVEKDLRKLARNYAGTSSVHT